MTVETNSPRGRGLSAGFVAAIVVVAGGIVAAGVAGFGNLAASVPGVLFLFLLGALGFQTGRTFGRCP